MKIRYCRRTVTNLLSAGLNSKECIFDEATKWPSLLPQHVTSRLTLDTITCMICYSHMSGPSCSTPPVLDFPQRYYSSILIPQAIAVLGFVRAPLRPTQCSPSQSVIASIETCILTDGVPVDGRLHRCYSCPTAPSCQCFPERHRPIFR